MFIRRHKKTANRSLWFRLVAYSAVWTLFALMLGGYLLSLTFKETMSNNFDERLDGLLENLIGISTSDAKGQVSFYRAMVDPRFEQPYSGWYWQISSPDQEPFRSRSLWDQGLEPGSTRRAAYRTRYTMISGPEGQALRLAERDITLPGGETVFRFAVAVDRTEITDQIDHFNKILITALSLLGLGLIAASFVQIYAGLRPLRNIHRALSRIRSGTAAHLPTDFPTEIQPLADEMNALLDHNNQVISRSRTQVGNLAHALKTPLAVLLNESEMLTGSQNSPLAALVHKQAAMMERQLDHYLRRARVAANPLLITSRTEVQPVVRDICRALSRLHARKKIHIIPEGDPTPLFFRGERQDLEEMVGNLIENAAKWAATTVSISCWQQENTIFIQIADDGPGINKKVRDSVFARGERLDENMPGTGLGLSIVKDLSGLYGGTITLSDNDPQGLLARLSLPAGQ